MNKNQERFFHLVRCGIGEEDLCLPLFADGATDWEYIFLHAQRQTVVGIVWDALLLLPAGLQPPRAIYMKWCILVARIEESNEKMNRSLCEISGLLFSAGIESLLLKGQGAASRYPKPEHRMCGDIDLYIQPRELEHAGKLLVSRGGRRLEWGEEKHVEYDYHGVMLELHHLLIRLSSPRNHRRLGRIIASVFSGQLEQVTINRQKINILPATLDAFYMLTHMYYHILEGGIGLRQLCDWVLLVHHRQEGIHAAEFERNLRRFHFRRVYGAVAFISVTYLGLPEEKLPVPLQAKDSFYGTQLMSLVMQGGNFGMYNATGRKIRRTNLWNRFGNYLSACKMSLLFFRLSPPEAFWFPAQKLRFYLKKL